jgi:hypothetical protein
MTSLVYDKLADELIGRTLTVDECNDITKDELLATLHHSGWFMYLDGFECDFDMRRTSESHNKLRAMTAEELKTLIHEKEGVLVRALDEDDPIWKRVDYTNAGPWERNVFPVFKMVRVKGPPISIKTGRFWRSMV